MYLQACFSVSLMLTLELYSIAVRHTLGRLLLLVNILYRDNVEGSCRTKFKRLTHKYNLSYI